MRPTRTERDEGLRKPFPVALRRTAQLTTTLPSSSSPLCNGPGAIHSVSVVLRARRKTTVTPDSRIWIKIEITFWMSSSSTNQSKKPRPISRSDLLSPCVARMLVAAAGEGVRRRRRVSVWAAATRTAEVAEIDKGKLLLYGKLTAFSHCGPDGEKLAQDVRR